MKVTQICFLLLLFFSCQQAEFKPKAKSTNVTKMISIQCDCPIQTNSDRFQQYFKYKIKRWSGKIVVQEIIPKENNREIDILITSANDESAFLEYLLSQTRIEFWHIYTPKSVPVFAKLIGEENMPYNNRMKMNLPIFQFDYIKDTLKTNEFLKANQAFFPEDLIWRWKQGETYPSIPKPMRLLALKGVPQLTNKNVSNATIRSNEYDDTFLVDVEFDKKGIAIWNQMRTEAYTDNKRSIVTVINNEIESVRSVIIPDFSEEAYVYGNFSREEAQRIADSFQDGPFNYCDLKIVSIKNID